MRNEGTVVGHVSIIIFNQCQLPVDGPYLIIIVHGGILSFFLYAVSVHVLVCEQTLGRVTH